MSVIRLIFIESLINSGYLWLGGGDEEEIRNLCFLSMYENLEKRIGLVIYWGYISIKDGYFSYK